MGWMTITYHSHRSHIDHGRAVLCSDTDALHMCGTASFAHLKLRGFFHHVPRGGATLEYLIEHPATPAIGLLAFTTHAAFNDGLQRAGGPWIETLNVQFLDELMLRCQGCQVHKLLLAHTLWNLWTLNWRSNTWKKKPQKTLEIADSQILVPFCLASSIQAECPSLGWRHPGLMWPVFSDHVWSVASILTSNLLNFKLQNH
jgi:hypothetical protein